MFRHWPGELDTFDRRGPVFALNVPIDEAPNSIVYDADINFLRESDFE
jgi:hypothetical protein